jgi:glyoxylase-like metal-dependent hydrolase (beta-lactamase superfamily II)
LRDADAEHYVVRDRPISLGSYQSLPVPGYVGLGGEELELHPAEGHTADGVAVFARWAGVLCVGDYLSDVEIPMVHDLGEYQATLARLAPLVEEAEAVVPGHGSPHDRDTALRLLDEDLDYLDGFAQIPPGRDTARQRAIHANNVIKHA